MLTRPRRRALLALVPFAVVPLLVAATHGSGSNKLTALNCGDTITTNTTLSADIGPCPGHGFTGLTIDADHVTLNLNGHAIRGVGNDDTMGVTSSHTGVTVENGTVAKWGAANVSLSGPSSRVINLRVSGAFSAGIVVSGANGVISGNRVFSNGQVGIGGGGGGSQYTNNVLQSNGLDGLSVANAGLISGNKALNNGSIGIRFSNDGGASMTVMNNIANGNANGIMESSGDATVVTLSGNQAFFNVHLGISGTPGVTDGGHNKASGNGALEQCTNIVCN
jgi:hypothetical protein